MTDPTEAIRKPAFDELWGAVTAIRAASAAGYLKPGKDEAALLTLAAEIDRLRDRLDSAERDKKVLKNALWRACGDDAETANSYIFNESIQLRSVGEKEPALVVDERDAALNLIMKMCNDAKEPCSTDPESAGAIRNGKFASIAGIAAQGLGLIRGPALSTPPAAPTTSQQADGWATARAQDSSDYSREHLTDEPQAVAVTELADGRWYWVRYEGLGQTYEAPALFRADAKAFYSYEFSGVPAREVHVIGEALAAFEAKKAGQA